MTVGFLFNYVSMKDNGIAFEQSSYSEILELAKKENKYVMLYFHFQGCMDCNEMESTVFVSKDVSDFYNENFVSFAVNTSTYEGYEINKVYDIQLQPTFLYLNVDGKVIHKAIGGYGREEFILEGLYAFNPIHGLIRKVTGKHNLYTIKRDSPVRSIVR